MLTIPQEIKDILHQDSANKNIRIHFPNGERSDICNDLIVRNSVKFTESLCSQNELKFGLCEASVFECEVVGVGNIKNASIEVSCEIECPATVEDAEWKVDLQKYVYSISYGTFIVNECKRQADMAHRKIVAYGGNYILGVDPVIKLQELHQSAGAGSYNPVVFPMMLNNIGAAQMLPDAIYTAYNQSRTLFGDTEYIAGRPGDTYYSLYRVMVGCKVIPGGLVYVEPYPVSKTMSDIVTDAWEGVDSNLESLVSRVLTKFKNAGIDISKLAYAADSAGGVSTNSSYIYNYVLGGASVPAAIYVYYERKSPPSGTPVYTFEKTIDFRTYNDIHVYKVDYSAYPQVKAQIDKVYDIQVNAYTLRGVKVDYYGLTSAMAELGGMFIRLDRENGLAMLNLKEQFGLVPQTDLYPGADVHPAGVTGGSIEPGDYQSCWYSDEYTKPFGAVQCSFKDSNNADNVFVLYLTGYDEETDIETYLVYDFSDNMIIKSRTWTEAQIQEFCEAIASNIEGVSYMPVEFVGRGLPYVEAGDTFEILTRSNDSITTIVLNRTISGEQVLTDSYKSV